MNMLMNAPMNAHVILPQFPIQVSLNPNNKMVQQAEMSNFPSYSINPIEHNDINIKYRRIIHSKNSPIIIE